MVALGVDVGSEFVKAVVLNQERTLASEVMRSSDEAEIAARKIVDQVLNHASLSLEEINTVAATGSGRKEVSFIPKNFSDPICQARGVKWLFARAKTIVVMGAHSSIAIKLGKEGKVRNFVTSDKCAGGSGSFLNAIAKVLHVPLDEFDMLREKSRQKVNITNFCAVFAESEAISLIHSKIPKEDIIRGIIEATGEKAAQLVKRIRAEEDVVLTGGVAKIKGLAKALEERLNVNIFVPEDPMITGAIGAALSGEEKR